MGDDDIRYYYATGHPSSVDQHLRQSIAQFARHGAFHRIVGITNNPERRWSEKYRDFGWDKMVVIYQSSCWEYVKNIERSLIESLGNSFTGGFYWNQTKGGEGRQPNDSPFYVYLVTANKWSRIDFSTKQ